LRATCGQNFLLILQIPLPDAFDLLQGFKVGTRKPFGSLCLPDH
jgi:hypothetical protein